MNNNYLLNQEFIPTEESFVENILRINKGKRVSIYQSYKDFSNPNNKVFTGIIENAGKDHVILSDPNTGEWYLLLNKYIDYIKFDEEVITATQFYQAIK